LFERFSLKTIAAVATLVAVAALIAGFLLDTEGFLGNLLAETVGVLLSVLLAIFIVERVVERERAKRWDLVSDETITTLRFAVIRAGQHVYLLLPAPRDPDADPYTLGLLQRDQLTAALRQLAKNIGQSQLRIEDEVAGGLRPHMEFIRGSVMPQLLAIGTHDLIARLAALESTFQDLEHTVWLAHQFGHLRKSSTIVANLIDALAGVSGVIDERTDGPASRPTLSRAGSKA
jgi:hypothetical protein